MTTDNRQIAPDGCIIASGNHQMTSAGRFMTAATGKIVENLGFSRNSGQTKPSDMKLTTDGHR
jgi:hypothetical protein